MWRWFERARQRQQELRQGVDADLVRVNRRRWKFFAVLLGCFLALTWFQGKVKLVGFWQHVAWGATAVCLLGCFVLGFWAREESAFLSRPGPEEPPRLWK
jgi:hypothetical protein